MRYDLNQALLEMSVTMWFSAGRVECTENIEPDGFGLASVTPIEEGWNGNNPISHGITTWE